MSRYWMGIAALLLGVTAACASDDSKKSSANVKGGDAQKDKPAKKTPKPPRPGSEGPIVAPPPLSPASPKLEAVSPASVTANGASQELTLTGAQFSPDAKVSVGGEELKPSLASATQLKVTVSAAKLKSAGSLPIKVQNPPTKGGASNPLSLTVASESAQMSLESISPSEATAGGDNKLTLTISGGGFTNKMRVRFNGTDLTTVSSTPSTISATVPSTLLRIAGQVSVVLFNPVSGSVTPPKSFIVNRAPVSSETSACTNRCVDFGYRTDQCYADFQCEASGCLVAKTCAPACQYTCSDYDYAPNECAGGWACTDGCLAPKTCESPSSPSSKTTCEYPCSDPDGFYSYAVGDCRAGYECGADRCLHPKTCSTDSTPTSRSTTCEYACVDPDGGWAYSAGECKDGYECGADSCLHQKTCSTATTTSSCTYPCVDPDGGWSYAPNECKSGYCCSSSSGCLFETLDI